MKLKILLWFLAASIITGCHLIKTIPLPVKMDLPIISLKPSFICLPIEIDVKDLEKKINKEMTGLLYDDNSFENNGVDNLKVKAWKKEDFKFVVKGNELYYKIPIKLSIIYRKFIELPEVVAEISLNFKSDFSINKDWTLSTKTTSLGYDWISSPVIKIAGFDISIKPIADLVIAKYKDTMGKEVDDAIKSYVNVRSYVQKAWGLLHKPIKINNDHNVWLKVTPFEIMAVPIIGKSNKINLSVAVKSINEIVVSTESIPVSENRFPDLVLLDKLEPKFSVNLNIDLPFTKINDVLNKELIGKTFSSGKKAVKFEKINVYGSTDFFIVDISVSGTVKGDIFLKGKPNFNADAQKIEIKNLEYDIDTKSKLLKAADWLMHDSFIKMVESKLTYSITNKLEEYKKIATENLKENKSIKGITMKGDLNKLEIDNLYITPETIKLIISLEGKLSVIVDGLSEM